jgi:hypothetical protein
MDIQLKISEQLAKEMLEFIETKIRSKQTEIVELENEIADLRIQRQELEARLNGSQKLLVPDKSEVKYQPKWPIFRKILFILEKHGRPMSTRDIVEYITELYEPEIANERNKLVGNVSSVLGTKAKEGRLLKGENILGENVFSINPDFEETKKPQAEQAASE